MSKMKKRYRLYVDESGDHTTGDLDENNNRYLCLVGTFIESHNYNSCFHSTMEALKDIHFHQCPDNDPVIFHRRDIVDKKGVFKVLRDKEKEIAFNIDLQKFFASQEYVIIGVTIDKKNHYERYGNAAFHPYHYCLAVLLERYCGYLNFYNAVGDVMVESRGRTEDEKLNRAYDYLFNFGTRYHKPSFFNQTLTSHKIKMKKKDKNISGLQLADLLAYDIKKQILVEKGLIADDRTDFALKLSEIMNGKYNCRKSEGRIWGYGKVLL
ncbi:MAG: DUF3800 domain-containing protein [Methanothrix sp.]|nr:DUF3800 domain-containing protein [Methanothrix sp.]